MARASLRRCSMIVPRQRLERAPGCEPFQEMHQKGHQTILDLAPLRLSHAFHLVDEVAEIELVEPLFAQQPCLLLSPEEQVGVVEIELGR